MLVLIFNLIVVLLIFQNFSMNMNKLFIYPILKIFMELKMVSFFFLKLMISFILFLLMNYLSYVYFSVGLTMHYGYVFIYAISLIFLLWSIWLINNFMSMFSHFLPVGIGGILKMFIPILEIIGVLIRPMTLAIRLATNVSCGHVVLLMFSFFVFNVKNYLVISITILLFGLYFIEFLVCVIQAYVSWSLLYIYVMEMEI